MPIRGPKGLRPTEAEIDDTLRALMSRMRFALTKDAIVTIGRAAWEISVVRSCSIKEVFDELFETLGDDTDEDEIIETMSRMCTGVGLKLARGRKKKKNEQNEQVWQHRALGSSEKLEQFSRWLASKRNPEPEEAEFFHRLAQRRREREQQWQAQGRKPTV